MTPAGMTMVRWQIVGKGSPFAEMVQGICFLFSDLSELIRQE